MSTVSRGKPVTYSPAVDGTFPAFPISVQATGDSDWAATRTSLLTSGAKINQADQYDIGSVGWNQSTSAVAVTRIDLGSAIHADFMVLKGFDGVLSIYRPIGFKVEYSDNDSSWTTVQDLTGLTGGGQPGGEQWWYACDLSGAGDHRYWRASMTHGGQWLFMSTMDLVAGYFNAAEGRAYTISPAADANFPNNVTMAAVHPGDTDYSTNANKLTSGEKGWSNAFGTGVGWNLGSGATGTVRVDLGSAKSGDHIAVWGLVTGGSNIRTPAAIDIEYSDNDSSWTSVFSKSGLTVAVPTKTTWVARTDISAAGAHRYWRAIVTRTTSGLYLTMTQFEFWQSLVSIFDPTNLQASVVDDDVTLTWDV